jgi:glutathione S-transferase
MEQITLTTMRWTPAPFQGQVRDLAVRWALEEIGARYGVNLVDDTYRQTAGYLARNPFGKVPVLEVDGLVLFESGAIVQHIGENSWLLPAEAARRAKARAWMFAALNSVDPDIIALGDIDHFAAGQAWAQARRPELVAMLNHRLRSVAAALGSEDYLAGDFGAADIVMIMVLRGLRHTSLVTDIPSLRAYRDRCEARPAFQRSLAAQLEAYTRHAPRESGAS